MCLPDKKNNPLVFRKPKPKVYTKDVHILVRVDEFEYVESLNGGIGYHIRKLIDAQMGKHNKTLVELEKRLSEIEPEYLILKKKIEEIKQEEKQREEEANAKDVRVEESHDKLFQAFKRNHYRIERMGTESWKVYSDFCGESVEALKTWVLEEAKRKGIQV